MAKGLTLVIQVIQSTLNRKGDRSLLPTPPAGKAPSETVASCEPAQPSSKAAENDPAKCSPVEINIESTRCDLHPLYVLRPVTIEMVPLGSDTPIQVKAVQCPKAGCDRHYIPEYGYFPFVPGVHSDLAGSTGKVRCTLHEHSYMAVAKTNGSFAWACLQTGCRQTAPFPSL